MHLFVSKLFQYPVKSARGVACEQMSFDRRGPTRDRRWMIVDPTGKKITQREVAQLARLRVRFGVVEDILLQLTFNETGWLDDGVDCHTGYVGPKIYVNVWGDECMANLAPDHVNRWLSKHLGRDVLLVQMQKGFERKSRGAREDETIMNGFADGYPLLITTEASLAELNRRLSTPVPMDRFRPGIILGDNDLEPFVEDGWEGRRVRIGGVIIRVAKPCARCVVITTDQQTGERMQGEPLKTLGTFRRFGNEIRFGMNADHLTLGTISCGDEVIFID